MTVTKRFHIGDLISIVVGNLVCPVTPENGRDHPIDGVYEILNFMSGDSLMTHALPRVGDECKPKLLTEYPWLTEIVFPGFPAYFHGDWERAESAYKKAREIRNSAERELHGRKDSPYWPSVQDIWERAIKTHDAARKTHHAKCNRFILEWLGTLYEQYGEWHDVWPLHNDDHESIHPLDEPIIQGKNIIPIQLGDNEPPPEGEINW